MARFRSKPTEIDATQWFRPGDHPSVKEVGGGFDFKGQVRGMQGWSGVNPGDWIITEPDGSGYYPCNPDVFAAKYEPVEEPMEPALKEETAKAVAKPNGVADAS